VDDKAFVTDSNETIDTFVKKINEMIEMNEVKQQNYLGMEIEAMCLCIKQLKAYSWINIIYDEVQNGNIRLKCIPSSHYSADIFTKPCTGVKTEEITLKIFLLY